MFKKADIQYIEGHKSDSPAWRVQVDDAEYVEIQDLATVYAYLCGYPWPERGARDNTKLTG